ncbi:MAG: uroporphyrinogen-III synthase [Pseudomonadota bacterium]
MTDLERRGVLITRATAQAEPLMHAVRDAGGLPILMPALAIEPQPTATVTKHADWVVFISPNAVEYGLERVTQTIANGAQVAAIGPSTARALTGAGVRQPFAARRGFDSESLLRQPAFQNMANQRVVIVRGVGGRELLPQTLSQRGARIDLVECYRRERHRLSAEQVHYLENRWASGAVDVTTCLSVATLDNLMGIMSTRGQRMFMVTPLVSPSERVLNRASELGHDAGKHLASGPETRDLIDSLGKLADAGHI